MASPKPNNFFEPRYLWGQKLTVENPGVVDQVTGRTKAPIDVVVDNQDSGLPPLRTPTLGKFKHVKT